MTIDQFREKYGGEWAVVVASPMFDALRNVVDEASPAIQAHREPLPNAVAAEGTLLGQIRGWSALRNLIFHELSAPAQKPGAEEDYSEPPV